MAKSKYTSVRLTDHQHAAAMNIAKRYKISQYEVVNRIFDIGLTVVLRSGSDLESARDSAVSGEIDLVIPSDIRDDISLMKRLTRRMLAIQIELMWIARDHAEKVAPGISKDASAKAEQTFRKLIDILETTEEQE